MQGCKLDSQRYTANPGKKKFIEQIKAPSNFPGGSFSKRGNVRAPI